LRADSAHQETKMVNRKIRSACLVGLASLCLLESRRLIAQTAQTQSVKRWTPQRTADGQPDLQGVWSFQNLTPLERPAEYAGKAELTDDELKAFEKVVIARNNKDTREGAGTDADVGRAYNDFWWDFGTKASHRTSLITDPPDGKRPALTPETQRKATIAADHMRRPAEGPEDRSLAERCIVGFNAGPPMLPSAYNNNIQIVQARDHVVIQTEMVHDARIVLMDGRPHLNPTIKRRSGDSRGRWEGDTLVVETTNFSDTTDTTIIGPLRGPSDQMHLIERFKRVGARELEYSFTIDDPKTYVRTWSATVPMRLLDEHIYEYACHEGNHGLEGILRGARVEERKRRSN
jgi:hypothetical protein